MNQTNYKKIAEIYNKEHQELAGIEFLRDLVKWVDNTPEHEHENLTALEIIGRFMKHVLKFEGVEK